MGSGKSTIGKLVAQELGREFIDTDEFLVQHYGPASEILNQPNRVLHSLTSLLKFKRAVVSFMRLLLR
jgi:cytidylate kinase